MSFMILDSIKTLNTHISSDLSNPVDLEQDTHEFGLKRHLIVLLRQEMANLQQKVQTLATEWDVDRNPPEAVMDYEEQRDLEEHITNARPCPPLQTQPRAASPAAGSTGSQEDDQVAPLSPEQEMTKRANRIVKNIDTNEIRFSDLLDSRLSPPDRMSPSEVSTALEQMFVKIRGVRTKKVQEYLKSKQLGSMAFTDVMASYTSAESGSTMVAKLCGLELALGQTFQGGKIFQYILGIVNLIAQLKFAIWWNTNNEPRGWKRKFKEQMKCGMEPSDAKKFEGQFNKARTSRNTVLRLYQVFGANAVLQPILYVSPEGKGSVHSNRALLDLISTRNREFIGQSTLLANLHDADPEMDAEELIDSHFQKVHSSATKLVLTIFEEAGGLAMKDWAKDFFDKFDEHKGVVVGSD
ncbi:hypothetical protein DFP72DRAFT_1077660 [Ephemerocybe angulata]|uniref:Uncharacterized protein n=1 Tax=Ephemerocybe angulata TaxID=980116 RepID=A0A8H6HFR5_9AGAR|nr:hypothetical protein DFP72DRAFT_1077660 [Tulosesus angulatus]